jgi:hypothetical protein
MTGKKRQTEDNAKHQLKCGEQLSQKGDVNIGFFGFELGKENL